ncbi:MBL fold metallo-hydrolase [Shimia sp. R10_1]|uniref:MBL fold metallo-hydrolase n=1 Tax=Shimia sp. R10_1 TaxID=2821095 RepID=UPI001AD9A9C3|nr:MBL fold metallo-hydrolase [Shimia sp. R10_1]MBO9472170.1 MBL fold metallo-hydrolase [Shimia sp. R10_1]
MNAQTLAFNPEPGVAAQLEANVRRVLAPNPSPMTFRGTNTYLIGCSEIAVIDPGPESDAHLRAILSALTPEQTITHIIVTHAHLDHSPLAKALSEETGAPIYAYGDADAGRSSVMQTLADSGLAGGGEGVDADFLPDRVVCEGEVLRGRGWALEVIHTPGHFGNHISLAMGDMCFCGDHVMGWASSLVSPPDGDLTDFMASCAKLRARDWRVFHAGHGAPIENPAARLDWLMAHRQGREAEILQALGTGPATAGALAAEIYVETPAALLPAATRNVFAHLVDLHGKNRVKAQGALSADAVFELM